MNDQEKTAVTEAILARTSEWIEAIGRFDAAAVLDLFDDSDEMRYTEHGVIYTSATLPNVLAAWKVMDEMDARWEERLVFPLAPDAATMTGILGYEVKLRSGEAVTGHAVLTAVFVKRGEAWKVIRGQESALAPPD